LSPFLFGSSCKPPHQCASFFFFFQLPESLDFFRPHGLPHDFPSPFETLTHRSTNGRSTSLAPEVHRESGFSLPTCSPFFPLSPSNNGQGTFFFLWMYPGPTDVPVGLGCCSRIFFRVVVLLQLVSVSSFITSQFPRPTIFFPPIRCRGCPPRHPKACIPVNQFLPPTQALCGIPHLAGFGFRFPLIPFSLPSPPPQRFCPGDSPPPEMNLLDSSFPGDMQRGPRRSKTTKPRSFVQCSGPRCLFAETMLRLFKYLLCFPGRARDVEIFFFFKITGLYWFFPPPLAFFLVVFFLCLFLQ